MTRPKVNYLNRHHAVYWHMANIRRNIIVMHYYGGLSNLLIMR